MTDLKRTPLHAEHVAAGARMVGFSGWHMPVQYTGIIAEHRAVRESAGIFDVSHMGEARLRGPGARAAVSQLITNDPAKLAPGAALYTVMCDERGGIVDDCIVYQCAGDDYLIILNAGNIESDLAWIREHAGSRADVEVIDESDATALIAVQGPAAVQMADRLSGADLAAIGRFHFAHADVAGVNCLVARTGYTGEDGFELACAPERAPALWNALREAGASPAGLGARDTLRLEARLCLYGNDIDRTTTPYEAGLAWVVKPDAHEFIGRDALLAQKAAGIARKLIGFQMTGRGIARHGYPIVDRTRDEGEEQIGAVTSGTNGITVGGAIGMGYVPVARAADGGEIAIDCRGRDVAATIVKGPFYRRQQQ